MTQDAGAAVTIKTIDRRRFEALAGYTRQPFIVLVTQEIEWLATEDERILGVLTRDRINHDFSWVVLRSDGRLRFREAAVNASLASAKEARTDLRQRMIDLAVVPDESLHQGVMDSALSDFLTPVAPADRLNPFFRALTGDERYSPARDLIDAMMRIHEDVDARFVEQFQTTAFDARLWELYLFATFTELGYARASDVSDPAFLLSSLRGPLGIEATTVKPSNAGDIPQPRSKEGLVAYLENYVPIKLARALKRKLNKKRACWELPQMQDVPFVLAIQDFHGPGMMRMIVPAATEYVFGIRHSIVEGARCMERIAAHRYGAAVEPSGFFGLPGAKNVSAVILNPQGTITKFNRMGRFAGFGDPRVHMVRTGVRHEERDDDGPVPKTFVQRVHDPEYEETWVEGMVVLHNPRARVPLDPIQIEGATHEFLQEDGSIISILPEFHPLFSQTESRMVSNP